METQIESQVLNNQSAVAGWNGYSAGHYSGYHLGNLGAKIKDAEANIRDNVRDSECNIQNSLGEKFHRTSKEICDVTENVLRESRSLHDRFCETDTKILQESRSIHEKLCGVDMHIKDSEFRVTERIERRSNDIQRQVDDFRHAMEKEFKDLRIEGLTNRNRDLERENDKINQERIKGEIITEVVNQTRVLCVGSGPAEKK